MLTENNCWLGKTCEQAVINHSLRTLRGLFTGLEHHNKGSFPCITVLREKGSRSCHPCDVHVVTTHVPDRHGLPGLVLDPDLAGIVQARRPLHGQSVHVGTEHHSRTIAVAQ